VNVLQRRMFAAGDEAASKQNILPLYEKHAKGNPYPGFQPYQPNPGTYS